VFGRTFVVLTFLGFAACREDSGRGFVAQGVIELLGRSPDERIQQEGTRIPTIDGNWGAERELGWVRWGDKVNGIPFVWSRQRRAFLTLDCVSAVDRTLTLTAWKPEAAPENLPATITLNGIELGEIPLTERPMEYRLEVPASLWHVGANQLAIEVGGTWAHDDIEVGFALAKVVYGEARLVRAETDARRLNLAGGTGVSYVLEPLVPVRLVLMGKARGSCTLEVRIHSIDLETGSLLDVLLTQSVHLEGDSLQRAFDLPSTSQGRMCLELRLLGDPETRFEVTRLELSENSPVDRFPIIFISIDTLSARHLSVYGHERETSPQLERFATDAVVFENCLTNAPWTLPSYMSQMTGLYAYSHRLYPGKQAELWELWHLAKNRWTLAEFLRAAGYATAGFVDNDWITERFGLQQGFDHFDATAAFLPMGDPDGGVRHVLGQARHWLLDVGNDDPFFLFLHAFDVHGPYIADGDHYGAFSKDLDLSRMAPAGGDVAFGIIPTYVAHTFLHEGTEGPADIVPPRMPVEPFEAAYDEVIHMVDDELGRFFDHLRSRGLYDSSLIVVSADHGETMSDGPLLFGHGALDQDVLHVPLIIKLPNNTHAGTRIIDRVQLVDLYPTLLDLLGRTPPASLHGDSLVPVLRGEGEPARTLLCEGGLMRQAAFVQGRWKLVEKNLGRDSKHALLLSSTHQTREWAEEARSRLLKGGARKSLFAWLDNETLTADFFEERIRTGLTEQLHARLRSDSEYHGLIRFLRRANDATVYELYDLEADPRCGDDLARLRPEKLLELKRGLLAEQRLRDVAQSYSQPPQAPPSLEATELQRLRALGYLGSE
jgi:arylsulfatase A-like enzyme